MKRLIYVADSKVIGDYPDAWLPPQGCDMHDGLADGSMVFIPAPSPPGPYVPTADEHEAAAIAAMDTGDISGRLNIQRLLKAKFISDLAWRLGKAPGALTGAELTAERNRIANIYKTL